MYEGTGDECYVDNNYSDVIEYPRTIASRETGFLSEQMRLPTYYNCTPECTNSVRRKGKPMRRLRVDQREPPSFLNDTNIHGRIAENFVASQDQCMIVLMFFFVVMVFMCCYCINTINKLTVLLAAQAGTQKI